MGDERRLLGSRAGRRGRSAAPLQEVQFENQWLSISLRYESHTIPGLNPVNGAVTER